MEQGRKKLAKTGLYPFKGIGIEKGITGFINGVCGLEC